MTSERADPPSDVVPSQDDLPSSLWTRPWVWTIAIPICVACGNFALLALLTHPDSLLRSRTAETLLRSLRFLGNEGLLSALAAPGVLIGFAFLARRALRFGRGWTEAIVYVPIAFGAAFLLLLGVLELTKAIF
ncbi:hypothetical protein [Alienimonas chondri]|uniref:Uncharacterized protein n=1 Tax=Alienimonas chondri TaxID=2681879 RepID=A0ABX1VG64_9PLAN|nr:hypothetical protein [Alienimonas chondri]NNJ27118.1 hypothetical protein [Alienimonas chondri]